MLIILLALSTLAAFVIHDRLRVSGSANTAPLGWMSEQWLAEYRASHTT